MDSDSISLAAVLVAKEASNWAFWTMITSAVSAIAAVGTIGVAMLALSSWHKQEALKVQVNFKHAILDLKDALMAMPQNWSYQQINTARMLINAHPKMAHRTHDATRIFHDKNELISAYDHAVKCWIMCDGLFEHTDINVFWTDFSGKCKTYMKAGGDRSDMEYLLERIARNLKLF